jgi:hypothetical protein
VLVAAAVIMVGVAGAHTMARIVTDIKRWRQRYLVRSASSNNDYDRSAAAGFGGTKFSQASSELL